MLWHPITKLPASGRSYLIRTVSVGPVYDVAFYNGRNKAGEHWWTLTDIEIDARAITHWCEITDPEDELPDDVTYTVTEKGLASLTDRKM